MVTEEGIDYDFLKRIIDGDRLTFWRYTLPHSGFSGFMYTFENEIDFIEQAGNAKAIDVIASTIINSLTL